MDPRDNGSLKALEHLMEEFFHPHTSNSRKYDIEIQLNYFKSLPHLWRYCIYFITNTSSQYVKMFALSTLESVITNQWSNIEWSSKEEIKNVIYNYLVEQGHSSPHFFRTKYAKLLVEIAKHDWPSKYPNFFNNILELLKSESNILTGLILLRTSSEEFMGIQPSYTNNNRKDEITKLLHQYIPVVFQVLTTILENLGTKPRHIPTATPPPSPAHPSSPPKFSQQLLTSAFRPDIKTITKYTLETIQHIFTWAPVQKIPHQIILVIFSYTTVSSYSQVDDDMCVLAMSTINELLYRNCTPPGTQNFYFQLYYQIVDLIKEITGSTNRMEALDPEFIEKLSELSTLLIEHHVWKLESEPNFSSIDFLSPFFRLTMHVPASDCYLCCLTVWATFLKDLKIDKAKKYSDVLLTLVHALLKKLQFNDNFDQLDNIDHTVVDENQNDTEWHIFVKSSIEVVSMIARFAPEETFRLALTPWKVCYDGFRCLDQSLNHHCLKLELSESKRLFCIFKDFSSLTQTLTRLLSIYLDLDANQSAVSLMNSILEKILESASLCNKPTFYELILKQNNSKLTRSFIDLHSQLLATVKSLMTWSAQKHMLSNHIVKMIIDITLPILKDNSGAVSQVVHHSAALLILSFTDQLFPPNLMIIPAMVQFMDEAPFLKFSDPQTTIIVNNAVSNMLLKPWGELNQEDSERRNFFIKAFFEKLTIDFRGLTADAREDRVQVVVQYVLPTLSVIIESCRQFPVASKKLLALALKPSIQHGLFLFPTLVRYENVSNHILTFFLNVMRVLQQQLGVDETKNAVLVFMQVTMSDQHASSLCGVDKLLQILEVVVEAPGSTYKMFLPGILQFCMESIYPLVISQDEPEMFVALLSLLYSILLHRWQYFYVSQVKLGYSPGCSDSDPGVDQPQKPDQLLAVLQVFGQALLQQDLNCFQVSLTALEDLNRKWKLYHKMLFRYNLLTQFLTVLLNSLLDKLHPSLSEDIQIAIFNMAAVNFEEFCTFLKKFAQGIQGVSSNQQGMLLRHFQHNHDTDMPTFVNNLRNFVFEAQNFRICNMS